MTPRPTAADSPPDRHWRIAACCLGLLLPWGASATPTSASKTLHVVLDDNYPPYVFRDESGKAKGLLVDLWDQWSRKTGVPVRLDPEPWAKAQAVMAAYESGLVTPGG